MKNNKFTFGIAAAAKAALAAGFVALVFWRFPAGGAAPETPPAVATPPDSMGSDLERRVEALEVVVSAIASPATPATPAQRSPVRAPTAYTASPTSFARPTAPPATPKAPASAWGITDFDRAIADFTPPPSAFSGASQ